MVETLCTTAQYLLALGANPTAAQILAGNMTIYINYAESFMSADVSYDLVANYASLDAYKKQMIAMACSFKAAIFAIEQDQNTTQLATTQNKLFLLSTEYEDAMKIIRSFTA